MIITSNFALAERLREEIRKDRDETILAFAEALFNDNEERSKSPAIANLCSVMLVTVSAFRSVRAPK